MYDPRSDLDEGEMRLKRETEQGRSFLTITTKYGRFSIAVERVPEFIASVREVSGV